MKGVDFLNHFVLPNFYFHLTAAYALLRHCGVDLGKRLLGDDSASPQLSGEGGSSGSTISNARICGCAAWRRILKSGKRLSEVGLPAVAREARQGWWSQAGSNRRPPQRKLRLGLASFPKRGIRTRALLFERAGVCRGNGSVPASHASSAMELETGGDRPSRKSERPTCG
jgi:hypothetical protein